MAFQVRDLCVLAYGNGYTAWHYRSREDDLATVVSPGYMDRDQEMLADGDTVTITAPDGVRIVAVRRVWVHPVRSSGVRLESLS